jgi:hypothetical protein
LSGILDTIKADDLEEILLHRGVYLHSNLDYRFRNDFNTPVEIASDTYFLAPISLNEKWALESSATRNTPLKGFNNELVNFYSLGGFDSIRGYEYQSIQAFRFFLLSLEAERALFKDREMKILKKTSGMRRFSACFLADVLFSQDDLAVTASL